MWFNFNVATEEQSYSCILPENTVKIILNGNMTIANFEYNDTID